MSVKVTIANLVCDENGKAHGGKPGDQTGKESRFENWYGKWDYVFRAKDPNHAERIAQTMEDICNNEYAGGYDQYQRTTLYFAAKNHNWNIKEIKKDEACESDCSAAVAVCINAAGIPVSKDMYTGNEKQIIEQTKRFTTFYSSDYTNKPDNLRRGDILLMEGHTAIVTKVVVESAPKPADTEPKTVKASEYAKNKDIALDGHYVLTGSLNIRDGAGTDKKILTTLPKGYIVRNYGYYTIVSGTKWLYVKFVYKNVTYTGFASSKYLKKQ